MDGNSDKVGLLNVPARLGCAELGLRDCQCPIRELVIT